MDSEDGASGKRVLGCSRCRYSLKGCSRCKKPTFTHRGPRQAAAGSGSGGRAANGSSKGAATSLEDADAAPRPAQRERRRRPHHTPHHLQQHHHYQQQYSQQQLDNDPYSQQHLSGTEEEVQEDPKALMQGVAFELTQLEQLQQDISTMQHRKRARTQLAADRPEGHGDLAKRLRTSLLGPAGAAGWAPGPAQAAAAGGSAHQQQHNSSSFAHTLEARVKAFAESGRRSVPTSPGSANFHAAAAAASPADGAAAAAAQAAKVKAEADLADMAAELGALAAAVSDDGGDNTSAGGAGGGAAHKQQHQHQHQQQRSGDSAAGGSFSTPSSSVDTADAEAAAAAAAGGSSVSPGGTGSKSPGARSRPVSAVKAKAYAHLLLPGVNPREPVPGWQAPASPFGLLEEEVWQNPWQLLLGCMLLNKTSGKQVRRVFWKLLELCPTPEAAVAADMGAIRDIIAPLGLHNKRAVAVLRLSQDYLEKDWTCPTELYGIGKYAADAYYMFCRGQWEGVQPDDKDLIKYHEWMRATGGQGMALEPPAAAAAAEAAAQAQAVADEQALEPPAAAAAAHAQAVADGQAPEPPAAAAAAGQAQAAADEPPAAAAAAAATGQAQAAAEEQAGYMNGQEGAAGAGSVVAAAGGGAAAGDAGAEADGEGLPEVVQGPLGAGGSSPDAPAAEAAGAAGADSAAAEAAGEQAAGDAGVTEQAGLLV